MMGWSKRSMAPASTFSRAGPWALSARAAAGRASPRARSCGSSIAPGASSAARFCCNELAARRRQDGETARRQQKDGKGAVDLVQLKADGAEMRAINGGEIGLIFQEPMTSFSPVHTVGNQIVEAIRLHQSMSAKAARARAIELLRLVGVPRAEGRVDEYAHQLSGGLRQRAMIAMALAADPRLLIADEPTTALDVTTQSQILNLLLDLQERNGMAIMLITHDLGVIAEMADDVVVMYLGRVVEEGPVDDIF